MEEKWVSVFGWEDFYEVSDLGRVRSLKRQGKTLLGIRSYGGNILVPIKHRNGYLVFNLTSSGRREQILAHRVILESFIGECPEKKEACHNNGDRIDNRLENLRWDTRKENHADKIKHGTWQGGIKNSASKLTEDEVKGIRLSQKPTKETADEYRTSISNVKRIKSGHGWSHLL